MTFNTNGAQESLFRYIYGAIAKRFTEKSENARDAIFKEWDRNHMTR